MDQVSEVAIGLQNIDPKGAYQNINTCKPSPATCTGDEVCSAMVQEKAAGGRQGDLSNVTSLLKRELNQLCR
jgi:hypothetical protein